MTAKEAHELAEKHKENLSEEELYTLIEQKAASGKYVLIVRKCRIQHLFSRLKDGGYTYADFENTDKTIITWI